MVESEGFLSFQAVEVFDGDHHLNTSALGPVKQMGVSTTDLGLV